MQWDHLSQVVLLFRFTKRTLPHWLLFCGCLYSHSSVIRSRAENGATRAEQSQNTFQTLWNSQHPTPHFIIVFSISKNLCVYAQSRVHTCWYVCMPWFVRVYMYVDLGQEQQLTSNVVFKPCTDYSFEPESLTELGALH